MQPASASDVLSRVAAAPISWGVCEVPGWGYQLPATTVLGQMRDVGIVATEFGPDGFLPGDPDAAAALLTSYDLHAVGGFVPVVLHEGDAVPGVEHVLPHFVTAGASILILAAATGRGGYDDRPVLDSDQWDTLFDNLTRIRDLAARHGVTATLHPHVGTMIETKDDVLKVLDNTDVALCLDTGHLLIGGVDPVALAVEAPNRIAHAHLKDVDKALARRVQSEELSYTEAVRQGIYTEAVRQGIYRPLGHGDIDIPAIVRSLESHGYAGWYVMEQDTVLESEPAPGSGPIDDVRSSLDYLRGIAG